MRAEVRAVSSPDVEVATYQSATPDDDGALVTLYVGSPGEAGEESFDVVVCTPAWLRRKVLKGPLIGRHHLLVEPFDLRVAEKFLRSQVERLEAPTWEELAAKIGRIGHWEFEDYIP